MPETEQDSGQDSPHQYRIESAFVNDDPDFGMALAEVGTAIPKADVK